MQNTHIFAPIVLRVSLGIVLIAHSFYLKWLVFGFPATVGFFESLGLPGFSAYIVFFLETVIGLMMIVGFKTKIASLIAIPILLGATWAHLPNGWLFMAENGGWEYPLFLTMVAIATALIGSGPYSVDERLGEHKPA